MPAPKPIDYRKKATPNIATGLSRSLGQGLLFGFADEVEAFARSLQKDVNYEDALSQIRTELEQFREEAPAAAYGTEIFGSIPSMFFGGAGLARLGLTGVAKTGAVGGGLYGAGAAEDPEGRLKGAVTGAAIGGGLSAASQKILPRKSKQAKELQKKGIPLTPGQSLRDSGSIGSNLISALEDLSTSYPGAGAPIQARRLETLILTNRALLEEAVTPLKIKIPKNLSPRESFEFVNDVVNKEYERVLGKLSLKNTSNLENKILNVLEDSVLNADEQDRVLKIVDKTLLSRIKDNKILGKDLKKAQTDLRTKSERFRKSGGFEGEIGDTLSEVKKVLESEIDLQNVNAIDLKNVNAVYRNLVPINDAMQAAVVQEGVFTPAQLLRAIKKADTSKRKTSVTAGQAPLQQTTELAQKVLGQQFPDSATASRLLAQDIIINPLKAAKLIPPALVSEAAMSRPLGRSPVTGILTSLDPTLRAATPAISSIPARTEAQRKRQEELNNLLK